MKYKRCAYIFFLSLLIFSGCAREEVVHETRIMMETLVSIKAPLRAQRSARSAIEESFLKMEETQGVMNRFEKQSEVSRINNVRPGEKIRLSTEMSRILNKCVELNRISDGAFDITATPLINLWGDYKEKEELPTRREIIDALESVGTENINLKGNTLYIRHEGVKIDLSGIAKGYVVDEGVKILKERGIKNCLIDAGGDMYCLGDGPDNKGWHVGIRHPREDSLIGMLTLNNQAVATSGDYQKFFMVGGKRFSHIIDPRTGYPVKNNVMSMTVITNDCIMADGLATALMVLGPVKGLRLVEELKDVEAIAVTNGRDGLIVNTTSGIKDLYEAR